MRRFSILLLVVLLGWVAWNGTTAISQTLTQAVNAQFRRTLPGITSIERVSALPWRIVLRHVRWNVNTLAAEPVIEAHRIVLQPSLGAMLIGRLVFSRMTIGEALITITHTAKGSWNFSAAAPPQPTGPAPRAHAVLSRFLGDGKLLVRRIDVLHGAVRFEDRAGRAPVTMHVHDLHLVIAARPQPQHLWAARIEASGQLRVRPEGSNSPFHVSGWFDPVTKDLQATFLVTDVELGPLEPYYQGRITKVRMYDSRLTLQGTAEAAANHLTLKCQATFSRLTQGGISVLGRTIADVGGALSAAQGAMKAEFVVRGPLDNPAHWSYQLEPNQAPLILLFLPFMKQNGDTTVINIGPAQLDVGQAVQQWMGSDAPASSGGTMSGEGTLAPPPLRASPEAASSEPAGPPSTPATSQEHPPAATGASPAAAPASSPSNTTAPAPASSEESVR